jgi:hypothetical protein
MAVDDDRGEVGCGQHFEQFAGLAEDAQHCAPRPLPPAGQRARSSGSTRCRR